MFFHHDQIINNNSVAIIKNTNIYKIFVIYNSFLRNNKILFLKRINKLFLDVPWMMIQDFLSQLICGNMSVYLCRSYAFMTEHSLNSTQIGSSFQ